MASLLSNTWARFRRIVAERKREVWRKRQRRERNIKKLRFSKNCSQLLSPSSAPIRLDLSDKQNHKERDLRGSPRCALSLLPTATNDFFASFWENVVHKAPQTANNLRAPINYRVFYVGVKRRNEICARHVHAPKWAPHAVRYIHPSLHSLPSTHLALKLHIVTTLGNHLHRK